ncbi:MAG: DUF433 domain-containing protein [Bacillota bacterium]|nr:DUF433 domain-containing protein [Bacillota bacterium]
MASKRVVSERIVVDPQILCGKPVIKGTRIPVYLILDLLAAGYSIERILEAYPSLNRDDIVAALAFAGSLARNGCMYPVSSRVLIFKKPW